MRKPEKNKVLRKKTEKTRLAEDELCSEHISVKATPYQKAEIIRKAEACGMKASPYLVARGFNYSPKALLTDEEKALLRPLRDFRLDVINYTNASTPCRPTSARPCSTATSSCSSGCNE